MDATIPSQADRLIGTRVGSYIIDRLLGQGGMGSVYVGIQPDIGKRVALKFLADDFNANAGVVARFFQEARAVNVIGHENIVDIFDFGKTSDGRNYFVMELLDGKSLEQTLVEERALSPARVVDIGRQVCRCLVAAHERGIVHRDLKPDNVFLIRRGGRSDFVKILDFGIAKLTSRGGEVGRTQTGMVLGTPGYMAPEQAGGSNVDHRADVYALGVILYRMLAGQIPFVGDNYAQILRRQLMEEPASLRRVRADVGEALDGVILRMLKREPTDRPQSMQEVEDILDEVSREKLSTSVMWYTAPVSAASVAAQGLPTMAPDHFFGSGGSEKADKAPATHEVHDKSHDKPAPAPPVVRHPSLHSVDNARLIEGAPTRSLGRGGSGIVFVGILVGVVAVGAVIALTVFKQAPRESAAAVPTAPSAQVENGSTAPQPQQAGSASPTTASPSPTPSTARSAPSSSVFTVHVESEPAGAAVYESHQKVGTTPVDLQFAAPASLTLRLADYRDEKVDATSADHPIKVTLKKIARPAVLPRLPTLHPADDHPEPDAERKGQGAPSSE